MSSLTAKEKRRLEALLGMSSGYVLNFTDRTFSEFSFDVTGKDILAPEYAYASGSKANRLRAFWSLEPDHVVAELLRALLEFAEELGRDPGSIAECARIAERLQLTSPVQDLAALEPNAVGREFDALAKSVRGSIQTNEPEAGLDRLHTFVVKYVRVLCQRQGIDALKEKPLHSIFGEYLKSLKRRGLIESGMAERILKSTISLLEAFNDVRNNQTLAHDNPLLRRDEALLIFNNVASAIRFLAAVEGATERPAEPEDEGSIPF